MKPFRLFFLIGIVLFMSSCGISENPDPAFDKEYKENWEPFSSPSESISNSETTVPQTPFSPKTFQIQGMDKGYQCTTTCTIPE